MESSIETTHKKSAILAHLAMFVFAALISGSFTLGHIAAPYIEPTSLNAVRFLIAFIIMLIVGILKYHQLAIIYNAPWRFILLGGLSAAYFITMFIALRFTSPISTSAVFTLVPLMSTAFGWYLLKQSSDLKTWLGLFVSACGAVWVIFKGDLSAILSFQVGQGELIFLIGCTAYAAYAPLIRKLNKGENTYAFSVTTLLACMVITVIIGNSDIFSTSWKTLPITVWLVILYLAVFTTAVSFFLLQFASLNLPASKVLSYGYLIPGFVVIYEGLLGHGWANFSVLIGVVITASVLFVTLFFGKN